MEKNGLFWAPRIMAILFAIFISLFALDAFGQGYPWVEELVAFLIHLIPTYGVIAVLLVAWKWPLPGGLGFIAGGAFYLVKVHGMHWLAYLLISGPLFLIGVLFLVSHFVNMHKNKKKEPSQ